MIGLQDSKCQKCGIPVTLEIDTDVSHLDPQVHTNFCISYECSCGAEEMTYFQACFSRSFREVSLDQ